MYLHDQYATAKWRGRQANMLALPSVWQHTHYISNKNMKTLCEVGSSGGVWGRARHTEPVKRGLPGAPATRTAQLCDNITTHTFTSDATQKPSHSREASALFT